MVEFKNKKPAMVLGEVVFALMICGIIMGLSVHMFKTKDVTKTPYLISVIKNLPEANYVVMNDCYNEGTCKSKNSLPDKTQEYCARLADIFVTSGTPNCKAGYTGQNFRLTNGISFFNMSPTAGANGGWTVQANPLDHPRAHIDAKIDIDGTNIGANADRDDVFSIRVFKNGEVVPGIDYYDDEELFAYRVILNRAYATGASSVASSRIIEAVDIRTLDEIKKDIPYSEKISFKHAICLAHGNDALQRYYGNSVSCGDYTQLAACDFSSSNDVNAHYFNDKSAFCTIEPIKPSGTGIFKIFGM